MQMSVFKIALVQQKAIPNDKNKNLELALQYIKAAGGKGADMVLFPEMWSNGYAPPFEGAFDDPLNPAFEKERQAWFEKAVALQSDYLDAIKKSRRRIQNRRLRHLFVKDRKGLSEQRCGH